MDDLISRKDALRPFCISSKGERIPERDCDNWQVQIPIADVKKILREVPSAEPQIIRCKDCKYMTEHYDTDGNAPYWTCSEWDSGTDYDGFCHYAERGTDA